MLGYQQIPLEQLIGLARGAAQCILEIYRTDFAVIEKQDRSPLTEADMASHEVILNGLQRITPDIPIVSEESAEIPFAQRSVWSTYWLIDPLDGTREFVKRNDEFTINVALIEDHHPVIGIVYAPVSGLVYFARHGEGAHRQRPGEEPVRIHARQYVAAPPVVVRSRSHRSKSLEGFLRRLGEHELIGMGSALKLCLVAEGRADVYPRLGPTSEWDTAAAQCVVEEAGGLVTDMDLNPLSYNTKPSLLNPNFLVFADRSRDWSLYLQAER